MYAIWLQVAIILLLLCKSSPNTKADSVDTMLVFRYKAGENGQESDKHPTSTRQAPDKHPTSTRQVPDKYPTSTDQVPTKHRSSTDQVMVLMKVLAGSVP